MKGIVNEVYSNMTPALSGHISIFGWFSLCSSLLRNRPFPSSKKSHFQNESKCETFVVKMSFICIIIKNHFHINGLALSLALKVRFFGTRKWPIARQWSREKFAILTLKPQRHVRILIYRKWAIHIQIKYFR